MTWWRRTLLASAALGLAAGVWAWRLARESASWLAAPYPRLRVVPAWLHADERAFAATLEGSPSWLWLVPLVALLLTFALLLVPWGVRARQHGARLAATVVILPIALAVSFLHLLFVPEAVIGGADEEAVKIAAISVLGCGALGALLAAVGCAVGLRYQGTEGRAWLRSGGRGLAAGVLWLVLGGYLHARLLLPADAFGAVRDWLGPTHCYRDLGLHLWPALVLGGLAAGPLTFALLQPDAARSERRSAAMLGLAAMVGLVACGEIVRHRLTPRFHLDAPDLRAAIPLDDTPETRVVIFGSHGRSQQRAAHLVLRGVELEIPASRRNAERLWSYLFERPGPTVHSSDAAMALVHVLEKRGDWSRLIELQLRLAERTMVDGFSLLKAAEQLGAGTERLLDAVSKPASIVVPAPCRAALAGVARRLGREAQAKALWQSALADGLDASLQGRATGCGTAPSWDESSPAPGSIRGQIMVRGRPSEQVQLLLGEGEGDLIGSWRSTRPDSSGRFRFDHLAPNLYQLHVEADGELGLDPNDATVEGQVSGLRIGPQSASLDVGVLGVVAP